MLEAAALSKVDLFRDLPASCLEALERSSQAREYPAGHIFFRAGETGQRLFLIERGRVQTFRESGNHKLLIADLEPPAIFGEMAFVGQSMYHCSAQTVVPSLIRSIGLQSFEELLDEYPAVTRRLLNLISQRFIRVLLDLESTSFQTLIPRIATLLLERSDGDCVEALTHKEIAERLCVYRESVTSALGELRRAGIVSIERKRIRILDRARLLRASRE
jgi:CRP-like cAMP-binding protein